MEDVMIKIDKVSKQYRLGQIGGGTLQGDLQSWWARKRGKEDPNSLIGTKSHGRNESFLALDDVSFAVKKGERIGIIGHNGAGKSTLLKLLSRVTAPTSGEIGLNGRVASMLEVGTGFHGELTGRENIYMNGAILGMMRAEIDRKMEDIIEFSECRKFIDTPVKRYSSGMYVKLAFSVAAHLDSEIMIMDEVLAVGDMAFQKKCLGKMNDVSRAEGRTILYVSHNMNTVRQLCDRVIVLDHGKLVFDGDVEKGIEAYTTRGDKMLLHYGFKKMRREMLFGKRIELLSLDVALANEATVYCGDTVPAFLKCRANDDVEKIYIRFEIADFSGKIIGTMISKDSFSANKDQEKTMQIQIKTDHLTPGTYRFDLLAFECSEQGYSVAIDKVEGALVLKLDKRDDDIEWKTQWWGSTRFEDIEIIDL